MRSQRISLVLSACLIALGLASAGYFIGEGISGRRAGNRIISVKGLSEKEVPASVATWTIGYTATGNDLGEINRKLADSTKAVVAFLKEAGFAETDMSIQPPSLRDTTMDVREKDTPPPPERYRADQTVLLRTAKVDAIKPALASAANLMVSGVLLSGKAEPSYIFNELNEIKPGMIQEATKNARIAAEQFSRDSQTTLGKLRSATQGWFQVENRDAATPERKIVRVVVDVEYKSTEGQDMTYAAAKRAFLVPGVILASALFLSALAGCGRSRSDIVGKWRTAGDSSAMVWEFSPDGSVLMGSTRGKYSLGDSERIKIQTSFGTSVYQMELSGDQMNLKDAKGSKLQFTKSD